MASIAVTKYDCVTKQHAEFPSNITDPNIKRQITKRSPNKRLHRPSLLLRECLGVQKGNANIENRRSIRSIFPDRRCMYDIYYHYICVSGYCDEKIMHAIDKLIIAELQRIKMHYEEN